MQAFCKGAPTKILALGADFLLTSSFRGVWGGVNGAKRPPAVSDLGPRPRDLGPRPRTDSELGLAMTLPMAYDDDEDVMMEVRKGDSQKADDASVPDHLWLHAFASGYGDPSCMARHSTMLNQALDPQGRGLVNSHPPKGWQAAMPGFCVFGLLLWRRGVTRGYVRWRWHNVPGHPNFPRPSQMVHSCMGMIFGEVGPVFGWSGKGREAYSRQWAWLRDSEEGLSSMVAGQNAIRRCANTSWFEWLEGSAPLLWNWPRKYQTEVRDGQPHYLTGDFAPPFLRAQKCHKDPDKHELMRAKVVKVQRLD